MAKVLKVVMIVWAVMNILLGLGMVFAPGQLFSSFGLAQAPAYMPYFLTNLADGFILTGIMIILAARDPLKHIMWLQFIIAWSLLDAIAAVYLVLRGNVTFSQASFGLIVDIIFPATFLILYPWRKKATA